MDRTLKVRPSRTSFRFVSTSFKSAGFFGTRLKVKQERFNGYIVEIVSSDFPLLVGLDVMRRHGLTPYFDKNSIPDATGEWVLPIHYIRGHALFNDAVQVIMFTKLELERLHFHFQHPSTDKLLKLLKSYDHNSVDSSIRKALEDIAAACATCSEYHSSPLRFRASLPMDELVFNQEITIDLLWICNKPVLHIIDTHTASQNSEFIQHKHTGSL